jgi:hypothetical protein
VPVHWRRDGRFRFEIVAEPAYHTYREASAPTFAVPLPDGTTAGPNVDPAGYAGQTSRGFAFDGRLVMGLSLGNHFDTSLRVALQEAPEFREVQGMFVLRYIAGGVGR